MIFLLATVSCISFTFCVQEFVADTMLGATQVMITQSIQRQVVSLAAGYITVTFYLSTIKLVA
jgi:hypothetical protein